MARQAKRDKMTGAPRRVALLSAGAAVSVAAVMSAGLLNAQPTPAADASALPNAPGRDLFASSCSSCHALGLAASKRRSPEEWRQVMQNMVGFGAQLSEADFNTIHTYLAQNLASSPSAAVAPPAAATAAPVRFARPSGENQWPSYGGGPLGQNFSNLTQIDTAGAAPAAARK